MNCGGFDDAARQADQFQFFAFDVAHKFLPNAMSYTSRLSARQLHKRERDVLANWLTHSPLRVPDLSGQMLYL
jgi:hypothetical protein